MTKAEEERSKEEILEKYFLLNALHSNARADLLRAMDEYARQEAIGFAEWIEASDYVRGHDAEQLYDLYKKQAVKQLLNNPEK